MAASGCLHGRLRRNRLTHCWAALSFARHSNAQVEAELRRVPRQAAAGLDAALWSIVYMPQVRGAATGEEQQRGRSSHGTWQEWRVVAGLGACIAAGLVVRQVLPLC